MAFDFSEERHRRPKVSLTSLIDVIFILIVFFMLVSSFSQYRVIDLVKGPGGASGQASALRLVLRADGQLVASDGQVADEALAQAVANRQAVSIFLERSVPIQRGVDALDRLKSLGVEAVSLVPEARHDLQ
jgi:biopolymer transport protein ExbD